MTKQHFLALADALRSNGTFTPGHFEALANFCAEQNPAFDRERWLAYVTGDCAPNGGKR